MIGVAASGTIVFLLTRILPKEVDIEETQQAIFYEMTMNRKVKHDE